MPTRFSQPSFAAGEVSPSIFGRVDLAKYAVGLKRAENVFVHPHGGASNRAGTVFVGSAQKKETRLVPFQFSTEQSYVLEFGNLYMRVIRDGAHVLDATPLTVTGISNDMPAVVSAAAHGLADGDEIYMTGETGMTELNGRTFRVTVIDTDSFSLQNSHGNDLNTLGYGVYNGTSLVATPLYQILTPWLATELADLKFVQSLDVMYLAHKNHPPQKLSRTGDNAWALDEVDFVPTQQAPANVVATPDAVTQIQITYRYKVAAINDETGEESLPSIEASCLNNLDTVGRCNTITWDTALNADRYIVYKEENGVFGYIGGTEATSFVDENIVGDTSDTPQNGNTPFDGAGNYPGVVTFHEQRLAWASTVNKPQTVFLSTTSNFQNMNVSYPAKADDAITFTLASRQANVVRHMVSLTGGLVILTSSGEFVASGGSNQDFLSPSSIVVRPQGYRGAADVEPILIGNTVLFVQDKGTLVRDLAYSFEADSYTGNDLTVLADHLFEGRTIAAWAYAQSPHSIVWAIRDDGQLLSFTYLREHEVWAWCRHDLGGTVSSVCSVSEGGEDAVYFVVDRPGVNGYARSIERLHSRYVNSVEDAFFVDSGRTYDGPPVRTVTGLDHLEGVDVIALADGNVVTGLSVSDGAVSFAADVSKVHVGLGYHAVLETLSLNIVEQGGGTAQGKRKRVGRITVRVKDTRGIQIGPAEDQLTEYKQRAGEAYGAPIPLHTGDIDQILKPGWNSQGGLVIKQPNPLPMTVLSIYPEITVGG